MTGGQQRQILHPQVLHHHHHHMCKLTLRQQIFVRLVDEFYDDPKNFMIMYNIIKRNKDSGGLSLRIIDFLCTMYTQRVPLCGPSTGTYQYLDEIYHNNLSAYGKANFDCFKRHNRILFSKHGLTLETTVAQLMFFRRMIMTGVVDYAREHLEEIKAQMAIELPQRHKRCKRSARNTQTYVVNNK
jgi:hypothetical protein